ncbi:MAG TPA: Re/Si-specific NAD(P)(+) transhydrogenase subunit alpha [Thermomicrobiales bacterium]|nr:Re/Si-specific NAD(P)(+) transhydrogenase subunit alpha [Thermomicrobiales bacterium]
MAQDIPHDPVDPGQRQLTIGVPKETVSGEKRVALIPETVSRLAALGVDLLVEAGAGEGSAIDDDEYVAAGATVAPDAAALYAGADLIVKVQAPTAEEIAALRPGTTIVSFLAPLIHHDTVRALAERGVTALAMDAVPRITRAQSMDALSAMSTIGGYEAVLLAADHLPKFFPLLMTAAGTIAPAKVLILGAGVAGLQAIATARRLGAVVEAYDTRPVVKEQVESLGAKFVEIDTGAGDTQEASGYARAATEEELRRQQEGLNDHIAKSDVVITTALVPGRPAPRLIPAAAVRAMRHGSVIVDLAGEAGGNCELSEPGETVVREGVTIIAPLNLPSMLPVHASQMYSRIIQNLLALLLKDGQLALNLDDEILKGMCITRDGEVVQEQTRRAMHLDEAPAADLQAARPQAT